MEEHETSEPWVPIPNEGTTVWDEVIECPDCDTPWPTGAMACKGCGLTIAEVAERLAP